MDKSKEKYAKLIFIWDGGNDYCPSKKILKKGDIVFPRVDHGLYRKLYKQNLINELECNVFPWKSANKIISKYEEI